MRTPFAFALALAFCSIVAINNPVNAQGKQTPANWSGLYLGANVGYLKANTSYTNPATPPQELKGALYGGQIGYNFQFKQLVLGVEADGSWGNLNTFIRDGNFLTENGKIDNFFTLRGRVGYAIGNFLPFATVGGVWTRLEQGTACPPGALFGVCAGTGAFNVSVRQTFTGLVYGGGVEYMLAKHWSIKGEALWMKLDNQTYTSTIPVAGTVSVPVGLSTNAVLRAGVNYHF